jgi:L-2-hydroxycarboxylate dehydrogenase (NAD+)
VIKEAPSTALVDGDRGLGLMIATKAMELAIQKAAQTGAGVISVRNAGHLGALGYYARRAAERNMIGWAMAVSNADSSVLPTFGAEPRLGTNPFAFAAPSNREAPFVFDAATSVVAGNKIGMMKKIGKPVPGGWVADKDGTPNMIGGTVEDFTVTRKPHQLPLGSTRELGSHKGYSLAVMVDILCGQLSFAPGFATLAADRGGHFVAAYDVSAFGDVDEFKKNMDGMLEAFRTTRPMPGRDRVYYAGLPDSERAQDRSERGIPLHPEVVDWFRGICEELAIPFSLASPKDAEGWMTGIQEKA